MFRASVIPLERQKNMLLSYSQIRHCSSPWIPILLIWSEGVWDNRDLKDIIIILVLSVTLQIAGIILYAQVSYEMCGRTTVRILSHASCMCVS